MLALRFATVAIASAAICVLHTRGPAEEDRCGEFRWPVKMLADRDRGRVDMRPLDATVAALGQLSLPTLYPEGERIAPYELHVFRVRAIVQQILTETDGDWHIVLRDLNDPNSTMIAEIPSPECSEDATQRELYISAREALRRIPRRGRATFEGIGFFDIVHNQRGRAPNSFELHPVQAVRPDTAPP